MKESKINPPPFWSLFCKCIRFKVFKYVILIYQSNTSCCSQAQIRAHYGLHGRLHALPIPIVSPFSPNTISKLTPFPFFQFRRAYHYRFGHWIIQYNYGAIVTTPIWNGIHPPPNQSCWLLKERVSLTTSIQCFLTWDIYLCPASLTSICSICFFFFWYGQYGGSGNEQQSFHRSETFGFGIIHLACGLGVSNKAIKIQFPECQKNLRPKFMDKYRSETIEL